MITGSFTIFLDFAPIYCTTYIETPAHWDQYGILWGLHYAVAVFKFVTGARPSASNIKPTGVDVV